MKKNLNKKSAEIETAVPVAEAAESPQAAPAPLIPPFGTVQLSANLLSIMGDGVEGGYLRITLCGFGPILPSLPGIGMLADAGIPQLVGPQVGTDPILVRLPINPLINPANTFYEISVLDANQNVIQSGNYILTGDADLDLSELEQIVQPSGYQPGGLQYAPCDGAIPGTVYTAPGTIVALSYNGIFLRAGQALPTLSYTATGEVATLNFTTQAGDRIDAICLVHA